MKKVSIIFIITIIILTCTFSLTNHSQAVEEENTENTKITFDKSVGINGFIDDSIELLSVSGTVREYHNYRWVTEKANQCRFTQGTWWNWDSYYKKLNEAGVDPVPCIQGTSQADRTGYNGNKQQKPINPDEDSLDPASYSEHAQTMYQFVARYGNVEVDDSKLLLEEGQTRVSGLGYIRYYENWNEPDKTWEGEECYFSPEEMAAMCSADYDGHEGRIGDTYGVKNADPDAKLVMGGVCNNSNYVNYLNGMKAWAEENRTDKKLPFDVMNFHMYVGKSCPEEANFRERFEQITTWRDENAPEKEIWMTEFGWDTNTASEHGATKENQRNWLMRTYLIANAYGIDRSTMYMSRDVSSSSSGKYSTCGLTTDKAVKKTSWYGVYTLKNALKDYVFDSIVQENDDVYIYKFVKENSKEECYVLWSPTGDGSHVDNFALNMVDYENITLTTFVDNSTEGKTEELEMQDGKVSVNVTETPIFVKAVNVREEKPVEDIKTEFKLELSTDIENIKAGDTVKVKVSISELIKAENRRGLMAISGTIEYDGNVLELDDESIKGLDTWTISTKDFNPENGKFVVDTKKMVTEPGDVFELTFKVKENIEAQNTEIKIINIEGGTGEIENGLISAGEANLILDIKEEEKVLLKGDVNLNGEIDLDDLAKMKLYCIDMITFEGDALINADLDDDGTITVNDLAFLKLILIGLLTNQ